MDIESVRARITYGQAHGWVRAVRGQAAEYACADCGGQADSWSYRHGAAVCLTGDVAAPRSPYSYNPDDYDPRCTACHSAYDARHDRQPPPPRRYSERHERRLRRGL